MPIDKGTGISIGLAIFVGTLILAAAIRISTIETEQKAMKLNTDKIPGIEFDVHDIVGKLERLEKLNDGSTGWKRPDQAIWCNRTEKKNDGWECADPYEIRRRN